MRLFVLLRALAYATGFVFLWGWVGLSVKRYDAQLGGPLPAPLVPLGVALLVLGGALALSCVMTFAIRGEGTPAPFDPPRRFVASGPYRWVRNPMYIGGLAALTGFAFWERSPSILVLAVILFASVHLFVILYEEPALTRAFGESYLAYNSVVRRWLPRVPRRYDELQ